MYVLAPTNLVNRWEVVGSMYVGQSWWDFEFGSHLWRQCEGIILFDFAESVNNKWSVLHQIPQQVKDGRIWLGQRRDDFRDDL